MRQRRWHPPRLRGSTFGCAISVVFALGGQEVLAQAERDVEVGVEDGVLVTGLRDFAGGGGFVPGVRVFSSFFGEFPGGTDDPGYTAAGNTTQNPLPFSPGTRMSFDVLDALRLWDGETFNTIPVPESLAIVLGFNPEIITPATCGQTVEGFEFVQVESDGGFHQHFNYFLDPFGATRDGIYLLTLRLRCTCGAEPSAPFYVVLRQGDSVELIESHAQAIEWVENSLVGVGCPGDADRSGLVNFADITSVLTQWNQAGTACDLVLAGDANGDLVVNFADITEVLANWIQPCDP